MSETTRFSPSTRNFYPLDINYGDSLPADLIDVPMDAYKAAMNRPSGHAFTFVEGALVISPPPPVPYAQQRDAYIATVRQTREAILNRLAGIGFAALQSGDDETADAVAVARLALLDITKDAGVLGAETVDELREAVVDAYHAIIDAAPVNLKTAFNGVDA